VKGGWLYAKGVKKRGYIITAAGTHIPLSRGKPQQPVFVCWWSGGKRKFRVRAATLLDAARRFAGTKEIQRRSTTRWQKGMGKESPTGFNSFYVEEEVPRGK
jgi:hypothetical protein